MLLARYLITLIGDIIRSAPPAAPPMVSNSDGWNKAIMCPPESENPASTAPMTTTAPIMTIIAVPQREAASRLPKGPQRGRSVGAESAADEGRPKTISARTFSPLQPFVTGLDVRGGTRTAGRQGPQIR